jgi:hypothetical protein
MAKMVTGGGDAAVMRRRECYFNEKDRVLL